MLLFQFYDIPHSSLLLTPELDWILNFRHNNRELVRVVIAFDCRLRAYLDRCGVVGRLVCGLQIALLIEDTAVTFLVAAFSCSHTEFCRVLEPKKVHYVVDNTTLLMAILQDVTNLRRLFLLILNEATAFSLLDQPRGPRHDEGLREAAVRVPARRRGVLCLVSSGRTADYAIMV